MNKPFIVAEISASHDHDISKATALVEAAADAGADAVKFQTFRPDRMVGNIDYEIKYGPWAGQKLIDLYSKAYLPWEWHETLFRRAKESGLTAFSTPFHPDDVDFLEDIGCPIYKVSSFDIINYDLLNRIAKTRKPVIISTGMATHQEIYEALYIVGVSGTTLLHCISAYPTAETKTNLTNMAKLRDFCPDVGVSDHSHSNLIPALATAMGATVIEKHIAMDMEGLDGKFALLPYEFKLMVDAVNEVVEIMGEERNGPTEDEMASYALRPSLFYSRDMKKGESIALSDLKVARPGLGMHPRRKYKVAGQEMIRDVRSGDPVV